jgi:hypothetical protein|tara:strand:- start:808 stop:1011 length:204 start_codon:yes stop_codon:yes gene_type:complete
MAKKYLVYFKERPPKANVLRIDRIKPSWKKFLKVEEYKGTPKQKRIYREVLSKITTRNPLVVKRKRQ